MSTNEFCVYNETRESFLSSRVSVIDTKSDPLNLLKVLIEGLAPNAETGLWLNPLKNIPAVPRLSSYDLVYLDQDCRVVHGVELLPEDEVPHFNGHAVSALVLPFHSFTSSQTHPGDQVIMRAAEETKHLSPPVPVLAVPPAPAPIPQIACLLVEQSPASIAIDPPLWGARFGQPQVEMQQFEVRDLIQSPVPKSDSSGIPFWRAIPRLRVHISISIERAPLAKSTPAHTLPTAHAWKRTAQRASVKTRITDWSEEFLHQYGRPSLASLSVSAAKYNRILARKYAAWKISFLRSAEVFIYGAERVAARTTGPGATTVSGSHRAGLHARDNNR